MTAVLRMELRKLLLLRRGWWIYLFLAMPVVLTFGHSLHELSRGRSNCSIGEDSMVFATIFQLFYLKLLIFFGCLAIFSNLFRNEVLERTLHYYFLAPVRREALLAGKYLAGLIAAVALFAGSVALSYCGMLFHFGQDFREFFWNGAGFAHLFWYVTVMALAAVGYGAAFLTAGIMFRNPLLPAAVLMVWESINGYLPDTLQKVSIVFYLKSLCPVGVPMRGPLALIAVVAEPAPAWLAIPGLLSVSALLLLYASSRLKRLEIPYT